MFCLHRVCASFPLIFLGYVLITTCIYVMGKNSDLLFCRWCFIGHCAGTTKEIFDH